MISQCKIIILLWLEERVLKRKTYKLWIDYLVKVVVLMMTYVRAEREEGWLLHVHCIKAMMPYFFAVGHQNHMRVIENFPNSSVRILPYFQKGKHVMQHMRQAAKEACWLPRVTRHKQKDAILPNKL